MHKLPLLRAALLGTALTLSLSGGAAAQEISEPDVKEIGKAMGDYFDGLKSKDPKGLEKARAKLQASLEKAGKKLAEKGGDPEQAVLAQSRSLGRALALSFDHKSQRGGRIANEVQNRNQPDAQTLAVWLPQTYRPSSGPYPLLLCVPPMKDGKPMGGDQFLQEHWTEGPLREAAILVAVTMPEDLATWTEQDGIGRLFRAFSFARDNYAIDYDRVFLLGRGEGVHAALSLASKFPDRFAGVVGRAGDTGPIGAENFCNLPTFLQGAGAGATELAQKSKELGFENVTVKPDASEAEAWGWIQANPRAANPKKVVLYPGSPFPVRAYWVLTQPTEGTGTSVAAEADRATNTIRVQSQGMDRITLLLNDEIVDLGKPVTVVLNGSEQKVVIRRNLTDMLNLLQGTNDPGRFYVAARTFDLPR